MKDLKAQYRSSFEQLQAAKNEVDYLTRSINTSREKLLMEFETWFQTSFEHPNQANGNGLANNNTAPLAKEEAQDSAEVVEDVLDYQEKFDRMAAEKILQEDPESAYFYNARKNVFNVRKGGTPAKKQSSSPNLPQIKKTPGNKKASPFK